MYSFTLISADVDQYLTVTQLSSDQINMYFLDVSPYICAPIIKEIFNMHWVIHFKFRYSMFPVTRLITKKDVTNLRNFDYSTFSRNQIENERVAIFYRFV